ncbi:MAG: hypothetical protein AcusKO_16030 [Acuticoccus sp.]
MKPDIDLPTIVADIKDELNDAVFDPTAWDRLISTIGTWAPDFYPLLHVETRDPFDMVLARYATWDPDILALYAEHYVEKNVFRVMSERTYLRTICLTPDHMDERELLRTQFYSDILAKNGDIRAASGVVFARTPLRDARFGFHYGGPDYLNTMERGVALLTEIMEPVCTTFTLAMRGASMRNEAHIAGAIDNLAIPALVLDDKGRMIRANKLATPLVEHDEALYLTGKGDLFGMGPDDNVRLEAAFGQAKHEQRMVTCAYRGPGGKNIIAHFAPMRRKEATDPLVAGFIGSIEPSAIVYLKIDDDTR